MGGIGRWVDRVAGSFVRRIARYSAELAWRDPGIALRHELQRRATVAAADFVTTRMTGALFCENKLRHLDLAISRAPEGLALEFGVFKGITINHLAKSRPDRHFHGFDSFRGLPEDWSGFRYSPVNFDRKGAKPRVRRNVTLIEGWFDETLPGFLASNPGPIGFVHVDCDIYSSTKTVLDLCIPRLAREAVIVFDEFFNYIGFEQHEFKALLEAAERFALSYRFLGYAGQQVSIIVDAVGRRVD
jgi:predicted O-methyltransferase YrrM